MRCVPARCATAFALHVLLRGPLGVTEGLLLLAGAAALLYGGRFGKRVSAAQRVRCVVRLRQSRFGPCSGKREIARSREGPSLRGERGPSRYDECRYQREVYVATMNEAMRPLQVLGTGWWKSGARERREETWFTVTKGALDGVFKSGV